MRKKKSEKISILVGAIATKVRIQLNIFFILIKESIPIHNLKRDLKKLDEFVSYSRFKRVALKNVN